MLPDFGLGSRITTIFITPNLANLVKMVKIAVFSKFQINFKLLNFIRLDIYLRQGSIFCYFVFLTFLPFYVQGEQRRLKNGVVLGPQIALVLLL